MSTRPPQNGSKTERGTRASTRGSASGRSPIKRGSGKRNRSSQMNTMLKVLRAVDKLGSRGRAFGTTQLQEAVGISYSQAYSWLQVFRAHKFVTAELVASNRPIGDWRWKRCYKIVKA